MIVSVAVLIALLMAVSMAGLNRRGCLVIPRYQALRWRAHRYISFSIVGGIWWRPEG